MVLDVVELEEVGRGLLGLLELYCCEGMQRISERCSAREQVAPERMRERARTHETGPSASRT